jgi:hypothetical protein
MRKSIGRMLDSLGIFEKKFVFSAPTKDQRPQSANFALLVSIVIIRLKCGWVNSVYSKKATFAFLCV